MKLVVRSAVTIGKKIKKTGGRFQIDFMSWVMNYFFMCQIDERLCFQKHVQNSLLVVFLEYVF